MKKKKEGKEECLSLETSATPMKAIRDTFRQYKEEGPPFRCDCASCADDETGKRKREWPGFEGEEKGGELMVHQGH